VRVSWDNLGDRLYEAGIDRCVLYVSDNPGVAWNGIVSIQENPIGGTPNAYYFEGQKYLQISAPEDFAATLTAFTYPDEFGVCDGSAQVVAGMYIQHQPRKPFSITYRTFVANDVAGTSFAYKIHLVYNAMAAPTQRDHASMNDQNNIADFVWNLTTVPQDFAGFRSSAHVIIDTRFISSGAVAIIEDILYGDNTDDPRIPDITELHDIISSDTALLVIDNGDGTFSVLGPDADITTPDPDDFTITWPTVILLDGDTYSVSSS
jgi:hypothetical protein